MSQYPAHHTRPDLTQAAARKLAIVNTPTGGTILATYLDMRINTITGIAAAVGTLIACVPAAFASAHAVQVGPVLAVITALICLTGFAAIGLACALLQVTLDERAERAARQTSDLGVDYFERAGAYASVESQIPTCALSETRGARALEVTRG